VAIIDIFSKRKKREANAGKPDVYQYDDLPEPFRVQVVHIWRSALGPYGTDEFGRAFPSNKFWGTIRDLLCRELGVFCLVQEAAGAADECIKHLLTASTDGALDIIQLSFQVLNRVARDDYGSRQYRKETADGAIEELNFRFKEHGIGYQFVGNQLIRVDSQYIHAETVKPALELLSEAGFEGACEEFIKAHDHYRHGRAKEAVAEALKAFESTMKSICKARSWPSQPSDTAKPLTDILFKNGLIPPDLQPHFGTFRAAMEQGLPTLSNRTSRHGQGPEPKSIPPYFAAYALHLAACNIVFLVEAHKATG